MGVCAAVGEKSQKRSKVNFHGRICDISPSGSNTLPRRWIEGGLQAKITRGWNAKLLWSPGGDLIWSYNLRWYPYTKYSTNTNTNTIQIQCNYNTKEKSWLHCGVDCRTVESSLLWVNKAISDAGRWPGLTEVPQNTNTNTNTNTRQVSHRRLSNQSKHNIWMKFESPEISGDLRDGQAVVLQRCSPEVFQTQSKLFSYKRSNFLDICSPNWLPHATISE